MFLSETRDADTIKSGPAYPRAQPSYPERRNMLQPAGRGQPTADANAALAASPRQRQRSEADESTTERACAVREPASAREHAEQQEGRRLGEGRGTGLQAGHSE